MARKKTTSGVAPSGPEARPAAGHGIVVLARNGDVIRYDSSGLVMRLSDKVIEDIALRLGNRLAGDKAGSTARPTSDTTRADPHTHLEGIDAWDLRIEGEWLHFSARLEGRQGVRGFRRLCDGGDILADAPGPLYGILGIGGPRAALASPEKSGFPQHVVVPADDIGAVGHAGIEKATERDTLEHLREMTHEALVAETLLDWQMDKHEAMPLIMTRVETDSSATAADLSRGMAYDNLIMAATNLALAARRLGKKPRLLGVHIDYALEDLTSDSVAFRDGILTLLKKVEKDLFKLGFDNPVFVARLESGSSEITTSATIEGQWELGWNQGPHRFVYSAPSYMFALDTFDRPTPNARREMAEMTAAALVEPDHWRCPTFYLAERSVKDPKVIRVIARGLGDLVIDAADPLGAGHASGFALLEAGADVDIVSVSVDPKDPQTVLLTLSKVPPASDLRLAYAYGAAPREGTYPANCGAVRDKWELKSATGRLLHRWALPCILPVTAGGGDA